MASTAYFLTSWRLTWWCALSRSPLTAAVNGIDAPLRFRPASGAHGTPCQGTPCQGTLTALEFSEHPVQCFGILVMDQFAVHGQRRYTDIDGAAEVSFLLGADGRLPVIDAGIPSGRSPA